MKKSEIISALENGNYSIKLESDCGCSIDWSIDQNNQLTADVDSDACWVGYLLYVNGETDAIAQHIYGESFEILNSEIEEEDIPEDIRDQMETPDSSWPDNDDHDAKLKKTLISYLIDHIEQGGKLYRDNERGFANEYECILVLPESTDEIDEDWDELEPEEWASEFLYKGDAATEAYNSHRVI